MDLCTIVDVNVELSEIYIGGHVSAHGAETLTWVIFKHWFYNREASTGFLIYRPLMWISRRLNVLLGCSLLLLLGFQIIIVFSVFHQLRQKPLATVEV